MAKDETGKTAEADKKAKVPAGKEAKAQAGKKAEADKAKATLTEHWRVCRVLRFTQPMTGPWLHQGAPKKLAAYGPQGSKLLEWLIYRVKHQHYTWVQC